MRSVAAIILLTLELGNVRTLSGCARWRRGDDDGRLRLVSSTFVHCCGRSGSVKWMAWRTRTRTKHAHENNERGERAGRSRAPRRFQPGLVRGGHDATFDRAPFTIYHHSPTGTSRERVACIWDRSRLQRSMSWKIAARVRRPGNGASRERVTVEWRAFFIMHSRACPGPTQSL